MRKPVRRRTVRLMRTPISLAILSLFGLPPALAQEVRTEQPDAARLEDVIVTGTRRDQGVQDVPFNISAVTGDQIDRAGLVDFADLARVLPGVFLVNQGSRASSLVVVRGLNVNSIGASEGLGNNNGGVMATYVGDIPLYVDLKLFDIDRVEVLLGPQGTLYGAGTLGGALRYIPNKPDASRQKLDMSVSGYGRSQADTLGSRVNVVFNQPLIDDTFAMRISAGYVNDPGSSTTTTSCARPASRTRSRT
jgi:outer membrane receptor protein involved in Fe transport